jgi:NADP-dependent 3-hydroxy acid dehydrogenase YdfG
MAGQLAGKSALVTGASSGIGRAVAATFAREGAAVVATARRADRLEALAKDCAGCAGSVRTVAGDIADDGFIAALAEDAGAVDILVNNAGAMNYEQLIDFAPADVERIFRVNLFSTLYLTQRVARDMVTRGGGHIVMMSSLAAREVFPYGGIYCASKHALWAISQGLRKELQTSGIRVSDVAPGMVDTEFRDNLTNPDVIAAIKARPFPPLPAQDVADAVLYAVTAPDICNVDLIELRPLGSG